MHYLILIFSFFLNPSLSSAQSFDETLALAGQSNSSPHQQYRLGMMYHAGLGVEANLPEGKKWIEIAAGNGNSYAMYSLGLLYERGFVGVQQYYKEVEDKYIEETGHLPYSSSYIGWGIASGQNNVHKYENFNYSILQDVRFKEVKPDYKNARKWYELALKNNSKMLGPRFRLGTMSYFGLGVEKNKEIAFNYFVEESNIAAPKERRIKNSHSEKSLGRDEDFSFMFLYYDSVVEFNIASMYLRGDGVKKDYKKAYKWFVKSGKIPMKILAVRYNPAIYFLGKMNYLGLGVRKNNKTALKYLSQSGSLPMGASNIRFLLPDTLRIGAYPDTQLEPTGDRKKALINSMMLMSHMYRNGDGVKTNENTKKQALGWNYYAALSGDTLAIATINLLGYKSPFKAGSMQLKSHDNDLDLNSSMPEIFNKNYTEVLPLFGAIDDEFEEILEIEVIELNKRAMKGDIQNQIKLAKFYSNQENKNMNKILAYAWATTAANNQSSKGAELVDMLGKALNESQKYDAFEYAKSIILVNNSSLKNTYEDNQELWLN